MFAAWRRVPLGLRRVVGRWLCKTPRLIQIVSVPLKMHSCLAQIGPHIFVGLEIGGIKVFDEAGRTVTTWLAPCDTPEHVEPIDLAASANGELVVLDHADRCIKVFRTDGTLCRRFGRFDGELQSLCTAPGEQVLVADDTDVFVFRQSDGLCLHTWRVHMSLYYTQSTNLCVLPGGENVLMSKWNPDGFDVYRISDGQLMHRSCSTTSGDMPQSVVMWQDCLFVVNPCKICVLRQCDGKRLIVLDTEGYNMYTPALLITRAGHLWAVAPESGKVFVFDLRTE